MATPTTPLPWKRYWCPRDGRLPLADDGYLVPPDSKHAVWFGGDAQVFDALTQHPCLVLLGEPGMGKSTTLQQEVARLSKGAKATDEALHFFDLREYGSDDRLVREVFDDAAVRDLKRGTHKVHLVLDSLDECLLKVSTVAEVLRNQLRRHREHLPRLRLWIACRTADWPSRLERGLEELWGAQQVGTYELAPLTRGDVELAARTYGIDNRAFFDELRRVMAVPLAMKPITLRFLLETFWRRGQLPATQAELYLDGCRILCEESSDSRLAARARGELSGDQRLAIACRIAGIMTFSNRTVCCTALGEVLDTLSELEPRDLVGGTEPVGSDRVAVDEKAVREVLGTGLFSSRGAERLGFAHQTYREFLAARYMMVHEMPLEQMLGLVAHAEDRQRIVPQLHETAAWLAGMSESVFKAVMSGDPQVLLRSDVAAASPEMRAGTVQALLRGFEAGALSDEDLGLRLRYRGLRHPGLHAQLEPYIKNSSLDLITRRVAIDVAEACQVQSLQGLLADIALDATVEQQVRSQAAHAVATIGDHATRLRLRPLADGACGPDPDDELKGSALRALWPERITATELFDLLTPQRNVGLLGLYAAFLRHGVLEHLRDEDLPLALDWAARLAPSDEPGGLEKLAEGILNRGRDLLEDSRVLHAFTKAAVSRVKQHLDIVEGEAGPPGETFWARNPGKRRLLVEALVPQLQAAGIEPSRLVYGHDRLIGTPDLAWLVQRAQQGESLDVRRMWAGLVGVVSASSDLRSDDLDLLLKARTASAELGEELAELLDPVDLGSPRANRLRAQYRMIHGPRRPEAPLLDPSPQERVSGWLLRCESGEPEGWVALNLAMTLEPRSVQYPPPFEPDVTQTPGWKDAPPETRQRILDAAVRYLEAGNPETERWLGTDQFYFPAAAGFRALLLLRRERPGALEGLNTAVWRKWAAIVLAYPISDIYDAAHLDLIKATYEQAPEAIIEHFLQLIDADNARGTPFAGHLLRKVIRCWDARLQSALETKVRDPALKPVGVGHMLEVLLEHDSHDARTHATSLVVSPPPKDSPDRERSLAAARAIILGAIDAGWSSIWSAMTQDVAWGEALVESVSEWHHDRATAIASRLTEAQAAGLYEWVAERYPHADDPKLESGTHAVSLRERVSYFRDGVLASLCQRGTVAACQELERLSRLMPHVAAFKWHLLRAKEIALQRTWVPPQPQEILALVRDPGSRLVESGEQLLGVIVESLDRWQQKLQGAPPAAFRLWNETAPKKHQPKPEDRLSDEVAIHLKDDLVERGVVINREVVIRPGEKPGGKGERTDIHVDAIRRGVPEGVYDQVTVIIESKGCWADDLDTAMEKQLRDRYLRESGCHHGLYLVGWFDCPQWDPEDRRRKSTPAMTLEEARRRFSQQAADLSGDGVLLRAFVANAALR